MYPFASVRWAWDALWAALARAGRLAARLRSAHSGDVHARWADPDCPVNHVCGWPLARWHADDHRVLGAFSLTIPEADGHRYRSTLVSPHDVALADLIAADVRVVANSVDSLSGWISLLNATVGEHDALPGEVTFSGAHVESLRTLAEGEARPCLRRLVEPGTDRARAARARRAACTGSASVRGSRARPSPFATTVPIADGERLAEALVDVLADDASAPIREALLIDGFVRLTIDDYRPVLSCGADRRDAPADRSTA